MQNESEETGTTLTDGLAAITAAKHRTSGTKSKLMVTPDMLTNGELIAAAISFALSAAEMEADAKEYWPWRSEGAPYTRLESPVENLAKAGALLASEIDRVLKGGDILPRTWPVFHKTDTGAEGSHTGRKDDFDAVFESIRKGIKPSSVPNIVREAVQRELELKSSEVAILQQQVSDLRSFLKAATPN